MLEAVYGAVAVVTLPGLVGWEVVYSTVVGV